MDTSNNLESLLCNDCKVYKSTDLQENNIYQKYHKPFFATTASFTNQQVNKNVNIGNTFESLLCKDCKVYKSTNQQENENIGCLFCKDTNLKINKSTNQQINKSANQ